MRSYAQNPEFIARTITYDHRVVYDDALTGHKSTMWPMFFNP
jgi:hypothetical protein